LDQQLEASMKYLDSVSMYQAMNELNTRGITLLDLARIDAIEL
jgi:hypothetical protein